MSDHDAVVRAHGFHALTVKAIVEETADTRTFVFDVPDDLGELFDYRPPQQNTAYPGNSDIGGHHIGFLVDDMDAAVAYLKSKGVRVQGEPTKMTQGPTAGETWVYFMAPWGTQLELTYYPKGLAYEKSVTGQVLWNPAKPDK